MPFDNLDQMLQQLDRGQQAPANLSDARRAIPQANPNMIRPNVGAPNPTGPAPSMGPGSAIRQGRGFQALPQATDPGMLQKLLMIPQDKS